MKHRHYADNGDDSANNANSHSLNMYSLSGSIV